VALLLGIDAGTTTVSMVAYDTVAGEVVWHGSEPHGAYVAGLPAGHREQDPTKILLCVHGLLARVTDAAGPNLAPDAICLTGQMHGFILLGKTGEPLTRVLTWEDTRVTEEGAGESACLPAFREVFAASALAGEGVTAGPGYAAANLFWLANRDQLPREGFTLCSVQDWLLHELSGRRLDRITTDPSCAHSTGLYQPVACRWDTELAAELGLGAGHLPAIAEPGQPIGRSAAPGVLTEGISLCAGLGDNQASFLGSVSDPATTALVNVGTGSQVSVWSEEYRTIKGLDTRPFAGKTFLIVGAPLCGGRAFSLLKDLVGEIGGVFFEDGLTGDEIYRELLATAKYKTDLRCSTTFSGSRTTPGERGSFDNLTLDNFTIGDFSGAIINGIGSELFGLFRSSGVPSVRLIGSGNGIRKNPLLARSIAEQFSLPLGLSVFEEEAALGAALVSGVGIGVFADIDAVGREVERMNSRRLE
jgi:sugar (pentulose or hexulose) kinase